MVCEILFCNLVMWIRRISVLWLIIPTFDLNLDPWSSSSTADCQLRSLNCTELSSCLGWWNLIFQEYHHTYEHSFFPVLVFAYIVLFLLSLYHCNSSLSCDPIVDWLNIMINAAVLGHSLWRSSFNLEGYSKLYFTLNFHISTIL